ncbi:MAG: hypothetical protein ACI82N_000442, partial [Maricaulis sp.]
RPVKGRQGDNSRHRARHARLLRCGVYVEATAIA